MKKTYKFLFLLVGIFSATLLQAQTNSYIFYNEQQNIVNPAAVGTETGHSVLLNLRSQWFQGASSSDNPQIQTLNTTHRITDRIGLGVSIANDKIFVQTENSFFADFSYSLPITEENNLYLGLMTLIYKIFQGSSSQILGQEPIIKRLSFMQAYPFLIF